MGDRLKIVRTDRELECPLIDGHFGDSGADLVLLPDDVSEDELVLETQDADLLLMCYTPITERVFHSAARLKGVVKYGVGIDAIDFAAANAATGPGGQHSRIRGRNGGRRRLCADDRAGKEAGAVAANHAQGRVGLA